ncbi:hypothetical protein SpAn4DRAFT_2172 [Sporomusa ovata]|uniref:Uncharacterized protein n=1 Tax=Sporomusa ovata TaxID=2378 RepID=A0A0U1KX04_9FIRM|nr:hypothetical protein SpAn4DRAFT_2172 [Sporomusa ovata]
MNVRELSQFFGAYITFFRATPLVAQLFTVFWFSLYNSALKTMTAFQTTIVALTFKHIGFYGRNAQSSY